MHAAATRLLLASLLLVVATSPSFAQSNDEHLANYFRAETARLSEATLADIDSLDDWQAKRPEYHRQLREMLGLEPWPEKTDLKAEVTGTLEHEGIMVENVTFQSRPGLYVTGNLYRPAKVDKPLPAVLYVCGHGGVKIDGVSYGNKTRYHHHGAWFARNGYVCLTIDSLQLGEIEGIHHGTYRYNMWWWINRGYTPAGVEAWNCVRALDYLETREEVDADRFGVTGRSGGGAYSWWIAALDERIKCAVPVAGITDLENHVVDGCVEGHCDCMFMVNTYGWDYPLVAALVAPRPLLISNTDRDRIFPLDGVVRTHKKVRGIYELYGKQENVALHITAGPHKDTQELRTHAFRWLNHHLKNDVTLLTDAADKQFEPQQLKVFKELPESKNAEIHETFVDTAPATVPASKEAWEKQRNSAMTALKEKVFRGWPQEKSAIDPKLVFTAQHSGVELKAYDFDSQEHVPLRLYIAQRADLDAAELVVLNLLDDQGWNEFIATYAAGFGNELSRNRNVPLPAADQEAFDQTTKMFASFKWSMAYLAPRGAGPNTFSGNDRKQIQIRRRFMLLGQTLDGMQVYDARRGIDCLRSLDGFTETPLWLQASREMAGVAVYASLFEPNVTRIDLHELPTSHRNGPILFNVNRVLDMPQAVALAAERSRVVLYGDDVDAWDFVREVATTIELPEKQFQIRKPADAK